MISHLNNMNFFALVHENVFEINLLRSEAGILYHSFTYYILSTSMWSAFWSQLFYGDLKYYRCIYEKVFSSIFLHIFMGLFYVCGTYHMPSVIIFNKFLYLWLKANYQDFQSTMFRCQIIDSHFDSYQ